MKDERSSVSQYFGRSHPTLSTTRRLMPPAWSRGARRSSILSRITGAEHADYFDQEIDAAENSLDPKVNLNWPEAVSMPTPADSNPSDIERTGLVLGLAAEPD
jgi:hypothetical protein